MTFFVDLRQASVGGSLAASPMVYDDSGPGGLSELIDACTGREVLFVTHGFNVDRASGVQHLGAWHGALCLKANENLPFVFVGVLWPGDARWLSVVSYPFEGNVANGSGDMLATFISSNLTGAVSISFASHSLGARVILETVKSLSIPVARLFVMAGAIEDDCLTNEFSDAVAKVGKISVLASLEDEVLEWAFPAGNLVGTILMHGSPYARIALGRHGPALPTTVTFGWQLPDSFAYAHGDYLPSQAVTQADLPPPPPGFPDPTAPIPYVPPNIPPPMWKSALAASLLLERW